MVTIELARPWTYRTPLKTIAYPAGAHEVFQYVADQAKREGALKRAAKPRETQKAPAGIETPETA